MVAGRPLSPETRAAILADIDRGLGRNLIARTHNVAVGTVTAIAQAEGRTNAFDRSAKWKATEAARADNAALRATTSRRFLEEANKLLDQLHEPHLAFHFGGKDNTYAEALHDEPPVEAKRNLMVAAAVAFDKHLKADAHDADEGNAGGRALIKALSDAFGIAYDHMRGEDGEADAGAGPATAEP